MIRQTNDMCPTKRMTFLLTLFVEYRCYDTNYACAFSLLFKT